MDSIEVRFTGGKRIEAQIGKFTIQTDQPEKYGGEASAPAPFDLFLGSLATCAGIFAWNFCESRQLPTEGLGLQMECQEDEKQKMISKIVFRLSLPEGFPERYHSGIIRAIELCAVKKHMQTAPDFTIEID
jgi:ribosomal protein S12 methylthiotransferase accessory factor